MSLELRDDMERTFRDVQGEMVVLEDKLNDNLAIKLAGEEVSLIEQPDFMHFFGLADRYALLCRLWLAEMMSKIGELHDESHR